MEKKRKHYGLYHTVSDEAFNNKKDALSSDEMIISSSTGKMLAWFFMICFTFFIISLFLYLNINGILQVSAHPGWQGFVIATLLYFLVLFFIYPFFGAYHTTKCFVILFKNRFWKKIYIILHIFLLLTYAGMIYAVFKIPEIMEMVI